LLSPLLSPDLVQSVLDALPTPVFFKDRAGVYRGCNRAFTQLMGKRPDELIGMTVFDLSPHDLAQVYFDADEALMSAGGEQRYEAQVQTPEGERRDVIFYKTVLRDDSGQVSGLVGTILDITERKALELKLADLAEHDALTSLLNRGAILRHLEHLHADRRLRSQHLCLLMCDVDHFKSINDRHGHAVGDAVLKQVAHGLRQHLRDRDRVGRIGGEEFLVVLDSADLDQARQVAERLRSVVSQQGADMTDSGLKVTVSIGLARSLHPQEDWADVVSRADEGLYVAKRTGRDRVVVADAATKRLLHKDWHKQ
jgi:diguanylate cyclase (GGDEF)-like protein/PAS domain S-box-containing protein